MSDHDTDYENLALTVDADVAHLTLDSTSDFNSLNPTMADELVDATTRLADDDSVRCITLRGTDGVFCAGADLAQFDGDESDAPELRSLASTLHDSMLALHQAPKPVVTGVNGVAAGAGFSMALSGDAVVMADDARLEFAYGRVGLTGDGGSTFWLPRLVGLRRAKELVLMDEPVDADYAVSLGLVTESVPSDEFDERLASMAERLADGPTKAFGATKRLLNESFGRGFAGQLAEEADTIANATRTEDYERGHAAFFGENDPEFTGR